MIIAIGGAGSCGKTFLAQKLLERHAVPYISLDHLKMGLIRGGEALDIENDAQITQRLWPIVRGIIEVNIENHQNIILEGCYLPADKLQELQKKYPDRTAFFCIGFSAGYINKYFNSRIIKHRNVIERRLYDETRSPEEMIRENEAVKKSCLEHQIRFFEIGDDFNLFIQEVFDWLDRKGKK
ncbi:MAG: 2-phosphoglycerate kinase [Alphaproteobacteria bacterium]